MQGSFTLETAFVRLELGHQKTAHDRTSPKMVGEQTEETILERRMCIISIHSPPADKPTSHALHHH